MKLINDKNDPDLLGLIETKDDYQEVKRMVTNMNQDLVDSGFDQYQYQTEKRGTKIYIRRV